MPKSARRAVRDAPQITLCSATSKGRRKTQEDAVFQWQISPHAAVLAVFDGHNGHAVADFGAECLEREFMTGRLQQALLDVRGANPARHLLDELSRRIGRAPPALAEGTGAAATIIVVSPTHIHCAHLGDCDAVLYRKPHEGGEGGSLVARQLTEPHRPGTARERARLEAMPDHAVIDRETRMQDDGIAYPFGPFRVYRVTEDGAKRGGLAVSRALGNLGLRPAVSSEPEAISVARTSQNDVCVVLGSDGLWDVAGVDEIAMWLTESPGDGRSHALTAAAGLLDMALQKGSQDNVSAGVIWL
ncbi:MAG: PP2C family protein-serine/threonine phosphatase [Pseudomonadota bacterium]